MVAPDEIAVEVAAGADIGLRASADLVAYDRRENAEHRALRALATDPREVAIIDDLIRGDAVERQRLSRANYISALIAQHARRLAGFFTEAAR